MIKGQDRPGTSPQVQASTPLSLAKLAMLDRERSKSGANATKHSVCVFDVRMRVFLCVRLSVGNGDYLEGLDMEETLRGEQSGN